MLTLYLSAAKSRSERTRAVRVRISERKEQRNAHPFCGEGTVGEGVDCVDAVYPERWGGGRGLTRVPPIRDGAQTSPSRQSAHRRLAGVQLHPHVVRNFLTGISKRLAQRIHGRTKDAATIFAAPFAGG